MVGLSILEVKLELEAKVLFRGGHTKCRFEGDPRQQLQFLWIPNAIAMARSSAGVRKPRARWRSWLVRRM